MKNGGDIPFNKFCHHSSTSLSSSVRRTKRYLGDRQGKQEC